MFGETFSEFKVNEAAKALHNGNLGDAVEAARAVFTDSRDRELKLKAGRILLNALADRKDEGLAACVEQMVELRGVEFVTSFNERLAKRHPRAVYHFNSELASIPNLVPEVKVEA